MAGLTDRLPLTDGTNRVIADPANPSAVGAVFDFATETLGGFVQLKKEVSAQKERERAEADQKTKASIWNEVAISHDTAKAQVAQSAAVSSAADQAEAEARTNSIDRTPEEQGLPTLFANAESDPLAPLPETAKVEVQDAARKGVNIATAVQQGRMPKISMEAALNSQFRMLREKYPQHVSEILDAYKKMGLDPLLFREGKDAADWIDFEREQDQSRISEAEKRNENFIKLAEEADGPSAANLTREQKIIRGMDISAIQFKLNMTKEQGAIALQNANLKQQEKDALQKEHNDTVLSDLRIASFNAAAPVIQQIVNLSTSLLNNPNDPELIKEFQNIGVLIPQMINANTEAAVNVAVANGYRGDTDLIRKDQKNLYGPLVEIFVGDNSVVSTSVNALKALQTATGLDIARSMPFFMAIKNSGIPLADVPGIMEAVASNPELSKKLKQELSGYVKDWGEDRASVSILNMIKILRGEDTLAYKSPQESRKLLLTLAPATVANAKAYVQNKGVSGDTVVNGLGEILVASRTLTPSSSAGALAVATNSFASRHVRAALVKAKDDGSVDADMARATIQASRAGSAHLLNNYRLLAKATNEGSPYFKIGWDKASGKAVLMDDDYKKALKTASMKLGKASGRGLDFASGEIQKLKGMQAPKHITDMIADINTNLDNAIEMGKHDPTTPKGTDLELREWYMMGTGLKQETAPKPTNVKREIQTQLDNVQEIVNESIERSLSRPAKASQEGLKGTIIEGEAGPKGYDSYYGDGQGPGGSDRFDFNLPKPVTQMTIGEAIDVGRRVMIPKTRGQIGHEDPSLGTSAIGAYQFTQETLQELGEDVFGKDWKNFKLTPENQDKLADALIEKTGGDPSKLIGRWPSLKGKLKR